MMKIKTLGKFGYLAGCFVAVASLGCSGGKDSSKPTADAAGSDSNVVIVEGNEPDEEQRQAMLDAKDLLFQKLSGRLMQAMSERGPAAAISVCKKEAPQIAEEVSRQAGLRIGRTGVRLRNANNQPPTWAQQLTENLTDTPTFVTLSDGQSAALLPIKLQSQCLMCHGPKDQIAPVVAEQLARLYPDDEATGFEEGELRGWFWIEKPAG